MCAYKWMLHSDRQIRNREIIELRLNGATLSALGAQFGMSRQAIHSIVRDEEQLLREYLEDMERLQQIAALDRNNIELANAIERARNIIAMKRAAQLHQNRPVPVRWA